MAQTSSITMRAKVDYTSTLDQGIARAAITLENALALTDGTGSGQADRVFSDQRTITASSSETLDLNSMVDPFAVARTIAKIKMIFIKASSSNVNNVEIGGAASNQFYANMFKDSSDKVVLRPGACWMHYDPTGLTVTDSSADSLKIANSSSGSSVVYDILIVGTSA